MVKAIVLVPIQEDGDLTKSLVVGMERRNRFGTWMRERDSKRSGAKRTQKNKGERFISVILSL